MQKIKSLILRRILFSSLVLPLFGQRMLAQHPENETTAISFKKSYKPVTQLDYIRARDEFKTTLLRREASPQMPQPEDSADAPPSGATQISFKTRDNLTLNAWMNIPTANGKYPAIVFLHGGFSFGKGDWDMTKPFRDAGFVVITPMLRGENGQKGNFTFLYNEVNDVIATGEYARQQPFIDRSRIYVAGHSIGGILTLLACMSCREFKKAASFSGLPDMVSDYKYVIDPKQLPFDTTDKREFQMRSPLAFATSFKCPVRMYFGTEEPWIMGSVSQQTAAIAKRAGLDVEAIVAEGGHMSAVESEMRLAIKFFNKN